MNFQVSEAGLNEVSELRYLSIQTFEETYGSFNTAENMELYISNDLSIEQLSKEINDPETEFHFALVDGIPVGFLKLNHRSYRKIDQNLKGLEIGRIYILKEFREKRIGTKLLDLAIRISENAGCNYIWLGVWQHNLKAQELYKRNGFKEIGEHTFTLGKDAQKDLILIKNL